MPNFPDAHRRPWLREAPVGVSNLTGLSSSLTSGADFLELHDVRSSRGIRLRAQKYRFLPEPSQRVALLSVPPRSRLGKQILRQVVLSLNLFPATITSILLNVGGQFVDQATSAIGPQREADQRARCVKLSRSLHPARHEKCRCKALDDVAALVACLCFDADRAAIWLRLAGRPRDHRERERSSCAIPELP